MNLSITENPTSIRIFRYSDRNLRIFQHSQLTVNNDPELVADDRRHPIVGDAHHLARVDLPGRPKNQRAAVEVGA